MSEYTPGPWRSFTTPSGLSAVECVKRRDHLATIYPQVGFDGIHEGEANARLMAAAPELLQACEAILAADERGQGLPFSEAMRDARKAIAKAEGR